MEEHSTNGMIEHIKINSSNLVNNSDELLNFSHKLASLLLKGYDIIPRSTLKVEDESDSVIFLSRKPTERDREISEMFYHAQQQGMRVDLIHFDKWSMKELNDCLSVVHDLHAIGDLLSSEDTVSINELKITAVDVSLYENLYEIFIWLFDLLVHKVDKVKKENIFIFLNEDTFNLMYRIRHEGYYASYLKSVI